MVKEVLYGTGPDQHDAGETHDSQGRCQPFDHVARGPVSIFVGAIGDKQGLKSPLEMPMQAIGATKGKVRSVPTSAGSVSFRQDLDRNEVPTVIGWRGVVERDGCSGWYKRWVSLVLDPVGVSGTRVEPLVV